MTKTLKKFLDNWRTPALVAAIVLLAAANVTLLRPATADAAVCGGNGQEVCTNFSATRSSTKPSCAAGTFLNIWDGKCYSCPSGFNRSGADIRANDACVRPAYTAFKQPRYTGRTYCRQNNIFGGCDAWNWVCREGFQHGTSGNCYSCDGYNRNGNPINSPQGCDAVVGRALSKATYVRDGGCPAGSFSDPRNGGECWSCPGGTRRSGSAVTAGDACVAITRCQSGMVEVRGKCYARNECGNLNQRPCLVAERIPSCRNELTESIAQNKCVQTPPGQSPFFNSLAEISNIVAKAGTDAKTQCLKVLGDNIEKGQVTQTPANAFTKAMRGSQSCQAYAVSGFACSVPSLLDIFNVDPSEGLFRNMQAGFEKLMTSPPCSQIDNPADPVGTAFGRGFCATAATILPPEMADTVSCIAQAATRPDFWAAIGGNKYAPGLRPACTMTGEVTFQVAKIAMTDRFARTIAKPAAKAKLKQWQADWNGRPNVKWDANLARSIERQNAAISTLFNALAVYGGFTMTNDVFKVLSSIPDCKVNLGGQQAGAAPVSGGGGSQQAALPAAGTAGAAAAVAPGFLYTVTAAGDLLYYRHDARGRFDIPGKKIGAGWGGFKFVTAAAGGAVYAVAQNGDLLYFEHDANGDWKITARKIGTRWDDALHVFAAGKGVLYLVRKNGDLEVFQHNPAFAWTNRKIGSGWAGFARVFSGGKNAIYAQNRDGKLLYYYHDDNFRWVHAGKEIGAGFNFPYLASGGNGELYGVQSNGELRFYRHDSNLRFVNGAGEPIGTGWSRPGPYGLLVGAR